MLTLVLSLIISQAHALGCGNHNVNAPNVPLCPKSGRLLNETFPVSMAFVSSQRGGQRFINSFASSIIKDNKNPPTIFVSASHYQCEELRLYIMRNRLVQKKDHSKMNELIVCIDDPGVATNWQQDYMQPYFNPQTGEADLSFNTGFRRSRGQGKKIATTMQPKINSHCPSSSTSISNFSKSVSGNGVAGGNIEGAPPNLCIVGNSDLSEEDYKKVSEFSCRDGAELIKAPTSFMEIGHTDEIMKTIKTGDGPCDYKILVADQSLGEELLTNNKGPLFDLKFNEYNPHLNLMYGYKPMENVCRSSQSLRDRSQKPQKGSTTTITKILKIFFKKIAYATESAAEIRKRRPCEDLTGQELVSGFHNLSDNKAFSKEVDKVLDSFANKLASKSKCPNSIIRTPALFASDQKINSSETTPEEKIKDSGAFSIFPNLTNGINIGNKFIYPDQANNPFNKYMEDLSSKLNIKSERINTVFSHKLKGNLHCSSNLVRYCRPR